MKKYLAALAAFVCSTAAVFATGTEGDIRSIQAVPVDTYGTTGNITTPLKVGETFYVRVRLLNEDWAEAQALGTTHEWLLERNGTAITGGDYTKYVYWPALRLAIGNKRVNAEWTSTGPEGEQGGLIGTADANNYKYWTDLYFTYTVKDGELGLPVHFVNSADEVIDSGMSVKAGFYFVNVRTAGRMDGYWDLTNDKASTNNFWFGSSGDPTGAVDDGVYPGDTMEHYNYDIVYPGIYVKTVDFDSEYAIIEANVWREVYQGLSDTVALEPQIIGTGAAENSTTVYIWSGDETIVVPEGDTETVEGRTVLPVTLPSGAESVSFKLKGGATAAVGSTATIYLSSQKELATNASGDIIPGQTVERLIRIKAQPEPYMAYSFASGKQTDMVEATTNYAVATQMKLTFSKAFTNDVEVLLNPTTNGVPLDLDATRYVTVLRDDVDPTTTTSANSIKMTKGTQEVYFYLYALGTCPYVKSTGIQFSPSIDATVYPEAAEFFKNGEHRNAIVKVKDQSPVIADAVYPASGFANDTIDIGLTVADNWRDLSTYNEAGYAVEIYLGGVKVCDTNGVKFTENSAVSFPVKLPAEGDLKGTVRVTDAMGNYCNYTLPTTIEVKAPLSVTPRIFSSSEASAEPDDQTSYPEGATNVYVRAVLSSKASQDMYAFVVPLDEVSSNLVETVATTNGLLIESNSTYSDKATVVFKDGDAVSPHATKARFTVVIKDKQDFDDPEAKVIDTYSSKTWSFDIENVVPSVAKVYKGTASTGVRVDNGATLGGTLPSGSPVTFTVQAADPGKLDLADTTNPIQVRFVYTDGPDGAQSEQTPITSTASELGYATANITFYEQDATQTIKVYAQDRDMKAADPDDFGELLFTFYVKIGKMPDVQITYPDGNEEGVYMDNGNKSKNYLVVRVSDFPASTDHAAGDPAIGTSNPLKIRLTVDNDYKSDNGIIKLIDQKTGKALDYSDIEIKSANVNNAGVKVYFDLPSQNGGSDLPTMFMVNAKVTNTTKNQYDTPWSDYFAPDDAEVYMQNLEPTLKLTIDESDTAHTFSATNRWTAGETVTLKYTVTDTQFDLTNNDVKVDWTLADTDGKLVRSIDKTAVTGKTALATVTGTYQFTVPSATWTEVTVTVDDGDGSTASTKFYISVIATKTIAITPLGPAETTETKYNPSSTKGLGQGHVYVDNSTKQYLVQGFVQTWNFNESLQQAQVWAVGYPASATDAYDDGKLGGTDFTGAAISASGSKGDPANPTACYNYGAWKDGKYDSFFYCWATVDGESGEATLLAPAPAKKTSTTVRKTFELDNETKSGEGTYKTVNIEAIFAREYRPADNMGDINADGVPDIYVQAYKLDGDTTQVQTTDLDDKSDLNDDADKLPGESSTYAIVANTELDYSEWSMEFGAVDEIRGSAALGAGRDFNNAPTLDSIDVTCEVNYANPADDETSTLSTLEYEAFMHFCTNSVPALDPTEEANWALWSPERPTDPTKEDTDNDGYPDGYEYYFWYQAHVGYYDGEGVHKYLTGRKYNPFDPVNPTVITSAEIESLFDPRSDLSGEVAKVDWSTKDSDNDGLADKLEFELGTDPLDFDTDGDGLPDGYEVFRDGENTTFDPRKYATDESNCDGNLNPDDDVKALLKCEGGAIFYGTTDAGVTTNLFATTEAPAVSDAGTVTNEYVWTAWEYGNSASFALGRAYEGASNLVAICGEPITTNVVALHSQVFAMKGFDPRTGWATENDYQAQNSANFTAADELLLMTFYYQSGAIDESKLVATKARPWSKIWAEYSTDPANADTDADGMPDGWEAYMQVGGGIASAHSDVSGDFGPTGRFSPITDWNTLSATDKQSDTDGLTWPEEYSGVDSAGRYSENCSTIECIKPEWRNKKWPSDPWSGDTDGDGMSDSSEFMFIYGTEGSAGGGLNPLSWDTDCDGLPDTWEAEFAGTWSTEASGTNSVTKIDATNTTAEATATVVWNDDGMDGTVSDSKKDYDHDGLLNWQEYMVGAMRCWRYDDTTSPWTSLKLTASEIAAFSDEDWYDVMLNPASPRYNPTLRNQHFSPLVYFSCANKDYEQSSIAGSFYMLRTGIYHDLRNVKPEDSRWVSKVAAGGSWSFDYKDSANNAICPTKYICCDPARVDTDGDGMDDYYELFHGLNPLLGTPAKNKGADGRNISCDIVYDAYAPDGEKYWSALRNYWIDTLAGGVKNLTRPDKPLRVKGATDSLYDFFQFPWLAGMAASDPDGDNIRNQSEALMSNVQAASTYLHTDPTPLWMTDFTYEDSLTYRYYMGDNPIWSENIKTIQLPESFTYKDVTYKFSDFKWLTLVGENKYKIANKANRWSYPESDHEATMFSFEENEGYDSDHDYLSDFEESQGKTKSASDAQDSDDPLRRQAMWFGGDDKPGFLQTPLEESEETLMPGEIRQNFLYYTVEAWVKADEASLAKDGLLRTVVERACWSGDASAADEKYLRKNFLIGIKDGCWYTKFDSQGTDAGQEIVLSGKAAATTNWTHVAATYDQNMFCLYVNGKPVQSEAVSVKPEVGTYAIMLDNGTGEVNGKQIWNTLASVIVGASAQSKKGICFDFGWRNREQGNGSGTFAALGIKADNQTTIADYGNFFKGYVDEVRIWDGARSETDIQNDVKNLTRYNTELAEENRTAVYEKWAVNGNRADDNNATLPAELMYHFTFDHVPGAIAAEDVLSTPAGFATDGSVTDAMAIWVRPDGWTSTWRDTLDSSIRSTIFTDHAWTPWINNTIAHLPRFDKTTLDSSYWSEDYAGATDAATAGYTKFNFKRTHEVYSKWLQQTYSWSDFVTSPTRYNDMAETGNESLLKAHRFARRNADTCGRDLLPFGAAYAKRISAAEGGMWDERGAADAWAETGADADNSGLPDWWKNYAAANYSPTTDPVAWDTMVTYYTGIKMTAGEAYKRDLARGMIKDGTTGKIDANYASTSDMDGDGMADWWEDLFGIDTGSTADRLADPDHDGLSNYQEYIVAQEHAWYALNPTLARTFEGQTETDYFLKNPDGLYLGEAMADHDFLEDTEETALGTDPTLYDAWADPDEDGWTAFAERRYSAFKMGISSRFVSHMLGEEEVKDFPIPVVHATIRYNGEATGTEPIIIDAYAANALQKKPTASYTLTPGTSQTRYLNLGTYEDRVLHGTLAPGHIVAGADKIKLQAFFVQDNATFSWTIESADSDTPSTFTGTYAEMIAALAAYGENFKLSTQGVDWVDILPGTTIAYTEGQTQALQITVDPDTQQGLLLISGKRAGTIDLLTGDFELDLSAASEIYIDGSYVKASQCFFRLEYQSLIPTLQTKALALSLGQPDSGYLTEGATAFVAYMDKDGDGAFTPGTDPIGFVKDVQVGWDNVPEMVIEMTDESQAAGKRLAVPETAPTIRIIRTTVNGKAGVKRRIVYSREAADVVRKNIFEADLVTGNKFGLDWTNLRSDLGDLEGVALKDVSTVGYVVVTNAGSVLNISDGDILDSFEVEYTAEAVKPVCVAPTAKSYGIVETQKPTFKWTAADGYTAFRLEIGNQEGTQWFWDSGIQVLPARNSSEQYVWTAPVFIGTNVCGDAAILNNNSNYTWRVAMYNAKFSNTNDAVSVWSEKGAFATALAETNDGSTSYGSANVTVKYFGPAANPLKDVYVELYETADFMGTPAARTRLFDVAGDVQKLADGATVSFHGLADGDYYAVAFIDRNGNGTREKYETWGYSAQVGTGLAAIWTPTAVTVAAADAKVASTTLYLEDTDINQNDIIDINDDEEILKSASETTTGVDTTDTDGDGLTGDEETNDTYTKKAVWDTDGDGMPDGWEARFADTDPLLADAETVVDGDVMAFAVTGGVYRLVKNAAGVTYLVRDQKGEYDAGDTLTADKLITTYDYATIVADETGTNYVTVTYAGLGTNLVAGADFLIDTIEDVAVALVHAQVYDEFGYSQRTAIDAADAYTKPFTALDKYMVTRYLAAIGVKGVSEEQMNLKKAWSANSLKPGDKDNDRDGIADGWELYQMFGTNGVKSAPTYASLKETPVNPWNFADRESDEDGDGLKLVDEYSHGNTPSDGWNKYSVYEQLKKEGILPADAEKFTDAEVTRRFALTEDEYENDDDFDQIQNAQEMWAYYRDRAALEDIDIANAWSDGVTPDYFRLCGSKYLGEMYNGAEFIEFKMRKDLGIDDLMRAGTRDIDNNGWDLWSEARTMQLRIAESYVTTNVDATGYAELLSRKINDEIVIATTAEYTAMTDEGQATYYTVTYRSVIKDATPSVACEVTLKYTGTASNTVNFVAYQTSSAAPEVGEEISATWTETVNFVSGLAKTTLSEPTFGALKQGKCRLVAFIDVDGDGMLSAKDIHAETSFNVGYVTASVAMRLCDPVTSLPVLELDSTNEVYQTIAIVRTKINGAYVTPRGVSLRRYLNNVNRSCVFPSEYLNAADGFIGLDKYLALEPVTTKGDPTDTALPNVETVTYEIVKIPAHNAVEGDDGWKVSVTNLNHYTYVETKETEEGDTTNITHTVDQDVNETFTLWYPITRDVPLEVKGEAGSLVGSTVVSFAIPTDRAITKFWLEKDGTVTENDGYILDCAANGRVILDEAWFQKNNITFSAGTHKIRVALGSDKFPEVPTDDAEWSTEATFAVNAAVAYDGQLAVRVLHPTPGSELAAGKITIAAYESCDLAEPFKTYTGKSTNDVVLLDGLRTGSEYYIAAWYVVDAADGRSGTSAADATVRMPYDTWGYLTMLGETTAGFDAKAVAAEATASVTNRIYLQDTDWNANNILDRTETIKSVAGVTAAAAPEQLDVDCDGVIDTEDDDPVFDNSNDSLEGDVMAYATKSIFCVQIGTVDLSTNWVWYAVTDIDKETTTKLDNGEVVIPKGTAAADLKSLYTTYRYGRKTSSPYGIGKAVTLTEGKVYGYEWKDIALVHHQVYEEYGFNPQTAVALSSMTNWVNTKKFTSLDKYIVTNYLAAIGALAPDAVMTNWTLNAKRIDFDFDGIPDGWELYTMFGKDGVKTLTKSADNTILNAWVADDRTLDADSDGLANLNEYNGGFESTDPRDAKSMYNNLKKMGLLLEGTPEFNDAIARHFGITIATKDDDDDNDLVSNLNEMLAYYRDPTNLKDLAIDNAWSDGKTPDYFRACGSSYLGLMFNAGEWIEPEMRELLGMQNLKQAGTRDYELSGWDYWSFARASYAAQGTNELTVVSNVAATVNLTLKYAGNAAQSVIVEMYQTSSAYPEYGEQMTARWVVEGAAFDSGVAKVTLNGDNLTEGSLKQGAAQFVVYIDADGDGSYTSGSFEDGSVPEPYGVATANIGYLGADVTVRIGDANPALPVLTAATNENSAVIAVVRSATNGVPLYASVAGVYHVCYDNNRSREAIYPEEYLNGDGSGTGAYPEKSGQAATGNPFTGLDAKLADDFDGLANIVSVTYEVVYLPTLDALYDLNCTNLNHYLVITNGVTNKVDAAVNKEFTVRFSSKRDTADVLTWAGSTADDYSFSFTVPDTGYANSRFWVKLNDVVYGGNAGYPLVGMAGRKMVLDKKWFEAMGLNGYLKVGDSSKNTIAILLGNDKYGRTDNETEWSGTATFYVAKGAANDGVIYVRVKHPQTGIHLPADITVAVYDKADLANPVVKPVVQQDCEDEEPIKVEGLCSGASYYVAAWFVLDRKPEAEREIRKPYDTWGYYCNLNVTNATGVAVSPAFDPAPVEAKKTADTVTVWLQDTDYNNNGIVDRQEHIVAEDAVRENIVKPLGAFKIVDAVATKSGGETGYDNDVMAYMQKEYECVLAGDTWYAVTDLDKETTKDKTYRGISVGTKLSELKTLASTYLYDQGGDGVTLGLGTNVDVSASDLIVTNRATKTLVLVHAQVYSENGFDSNTANGYIASTEWTPNSTKIFTAADRNYLTNYLANVLGVKSDTWAEFKLPGTSSDNDTDGITDGWELYVMFQKGSFSADSRTWPHSPWNYADRANDVDGDGLDQLHEYNGGYDPTDPWNGDTAGNGVGDKAAYDFNLKGENAFRDDTDNDQLSNFMEYMISSMSGFPTLDAGRLMTAGEKYDGSQKVPDYFLPHGKLYLGEMFADHDLIEDWWEDEQPVEDEDGNAGYSRYVYDTNDDADGDGWDNWSEARASIAMGPTNVVTVTTNGSTVVTTTEKKWLYDLNGGSPTPTVKITLRYNGDWGSLTNQTVTVQAWQEGNEVDPYLTAEPDATWEVALEGDVLKHLDNDYELTTENLVGGHVRGGKNTFVAFVGTGTPAAGAPYGIARSVSVGFVESERFAIELTDTDPSIIRFNLKDALTEQASLTHEGDKYPTDKSDTDAENDLSTFNAQNALTDRGAHSLRWYPNVCNEYVGTSNIVSTGKVRIRVLRSCINGVGDYWGSYFTRQLLDAYVDLEHRPIVSELDLLVRGEHDLDWPDGERGLVTEWEAAWKKATEGYSNRSDITNATYRIVIGDGTTLSTNLNNNLALAFVNAFEYGKQQTLAVPTKVQANRIRPIFSWTHTNTIDKAYPAFRLRIWKGSKAVYDSGIVRSPARDANGVYSWTAPISVGMPLENGNTLESNTEYSWSVSMLDAKFTDPNSSETKMSFRTPTISDTAAMSDYGNIVCSVKYMGPGEVSTTEAEGLIRVEAFKTPDFAGTPYAATYVKHAENLAATNIVEINAWLAGLPRGETFYVRAFIDTNGNAERDDWESWGYGNYVCDEVRKDVYTPYAYTVKAKTEDDGKTPECVIFIEDCDTNNNKLPDVWEVENGGLGKTTVKTSSPYFITIDENGKAAANNIFAKIADTGAVKLPFYSALTSFENGDSLSSVSLALAIAGISDLDDIVTDADVHITSFSMTDGITIEVTPRATIDAKTLAPEIVTLNVTLKLTLQMVDDFSGEWTTVGEPVTQTFKLTNESQTVDAAELAKLNEALKAQIPAGAKGFFRVTAEVSSVE